MTWKPAVVALYTLGLVYITLYSLFQAHLLIHFHRWRRARSAPPLPLEGDEPELPSVTIQIPLFNEAQVVEALLDSIAGLRWPSDRLEIQILDDSTDETSEIVSRKLIPMRARGLEVYHIRRQDRAGFKAGALHVGTGVAKGEYLAIFDADFAPDPDFLLRTMPYFDSPEVGVVQARWGHLNRWDSLVTRIQAIHLDGFFLIEQPARAFAGYLLRFNGSAGIWRKKCIEDAGDWRGDTLSEDLDLVLRAQLRGWKVANAYDVVAKAEIPPRFEDFKEQQYRWTKGKMQVLKKMAGALLRAPLGLGKTAHAFADLLNMFLYPAALSCALLSFPMAWILYGQTEGFPDYLVDTSFALVSLFVWMHFLVIIIGSEFPTFLKKGMEFGKLFPMMLLTVLGSSVFQSAAIWAGLRKGSGEFVRTEKFGRTEAGAPTPKRSGIRRPGIAVMEAFFLVYFSGALVLDWRLSAWGFVPLHLFLFFGFAFMVWNSLEILTSTN